MTLAQAILYPLAACVIGGGIVAALLAVVFCPAALFGASVERDPVTGEVG